ncbi:UbiA family prenyltransferase [Desulfococcus multivorans]|jgi:4-hydroxybenzoate polyprenyltransferase|uniref:UbiA prenyltransferase n=1 Tax=Desulfococcus multivorans DSM 2059 TaxID=1121405 RepID=S7VEV8_DESML|nr:UbiA family prenyltransferase [Desulfococcus multivorans]AOY59303.1 UbiA1: 4-hydroxybenzoate octaprenyltransferase [Desulfococcus multivorans]AQV01525.1 ubiquinone biosynthesis protein UbiA [Desulfococcus multivorans]EPR43003.1 UbiA prenyltransferase [Desulfococcus multivorans DSM 2059]SKA14696.1 4-hydroxybenzoate polyprenyltransferase [Desulfococcus multivorans DSM 2059]
MLKTTANPMRFIRDHRFKLFVALSRTPHGLLDMTTPCFAACLWLGGLPPLPVLLLGIVTVFAGYTAVYALNDVVDYRVDQEKLRQADCRVRTGTEDIDAALVRHPMAQGLLRFREGLFWSAAWAAVALVGAYLLNPVCAWIFIGGCLLEATYCLLLKVSPMRIFINGIVKTLGAVAAVFAVDPHPSGLFLATLFFMLFFWEVGGQNIPNDSSDMDEDIQLNAKTVPVRFGLDFSSFAAVVTLGAAVLLTLVLFSLSRARFSAIDYLVVLSLGIWLLIMPAAEFRRNPTQVSAMRLFNRASWYPPALFSITALRILFLA